MVLLRHLELIPTSAIRRESEVRHHTFRLMYNRRWQQQQTARSDRWKREDDAPRLKDRILDLDSLKIELEEWRKDETEPVAGTRRVRHIVVPRAAALFEVPCSDKKCNGGGHDLTDVVLAALEAKQTLVEGRHVCEGTREDNPCGLLLQFKAVASFRAHPGEG